MISERTFAGSFPAFWMDLLPFLTPRLVHLINVEFSKSIYDDNGLPLNHIPKYPETRDSAVISEFAFFLAKISIQERKSIAEVSNSNELMKIAQERALNVVTKYEKSDLSLTLPLSHEERDEGLLLAYNYSRFFDQRCEDLSIEFSPTIPGAGFLSKCSGDISIDSSLFEVKTVNRNLASKDIRQLVIYLALQNATGERRWEKAGFFNPRRSNYHEFYVDEIIEQMAGGRSSSEIFQELTDFITRRDIQFDTKF